MSVLSDPKHVRVWPQAGARPSASLGPSESPTESEPISMSSIVNNIFADSDTKTAALRSEVKTNLTVTNIWRHPEAHPIALMLLLLDRYGPEYVEWDVEVLRLTMQRDSLAISNSVWNKICAGRVVLNSPSPWRQWNVFHYVCRALSGESPNFVYLEEPELAHLIVGYGVMKVVDPKRTTGIEIDKYIAAAYKHEGLPYIPPPLSFAQRELEEQKLKCSSCGAIHRDDNDIKCVTCAKSTLQRLPYEHEALKLSVKALFDQRKLLPLESAVEDLPDDGVGNAVYRLLVDWDYARTTKDRLAGQLKMIGAK